MATPEFDHAACEAELVDVALDAAPSPEAELHLEGCARCARALQSHRAIWAAVASLPGHPPLAALRDSVLAAAALSLKGTTPKPRPGARTFGSVDDTPSGSAHPGARAFDQNLPPGRPTRDVKAHVLHAAAAVTAGIAPPSVERFKDVQSEVGRPPGASASPAPRPSRLGWMAFFLVAVVGAGALVLAPSAERPIESPRAAMEATAPVLDESPPPNAPPPNAPLPNAPLPNAPLPNAPLPNAPQPRATGEHAEPVVEELVPRPAVALAPSEQAEARPEHLPEAGVAPTPAVPAAAPPRVIFLSRLLRESGASQSRAKAASLLGLSQDLAAVAPLCEAMTDPDRLVRAAVVEALGDLGTSEQACLGPSEKQRFLEFAEFEPLVSGEVLSEEQARLAGRLVRQSLARHSVGLAGGVDGGSEPLRYRLQLHVSVDDDRLRVEVLVMRLPQRAVVGAWSGRASGGAKLEAKLKVLVPRVIDDVSSDLGWPPAPPQ
ncbi:MAG: HEAT repeat domain-containing protein [Archangium sp.]|nr:HEAT repeat domain-containing protein [Archangium sp.]